MTRHRTGEPIVVKVGGSLYHHPQFVSGLREYLNSFYQKAGRILIVPGGGLFVDVVRELQSIHPFDDEDAHHMAMMACFVSHDFLYRVVAPHGRTAGYASLNWYNTEVDNVPYRPYRLLNFHHFSKAYEERFGPLPHTWELTTDSIAAYAAGVAGCRLILLKSVDIPPGTSWRTAADEGWVDAHFPEVVEKFSLQVEVINFRRVLDARI